MTTRTDNITSEWVAWGSNFYDEPAFSAFSDGSIAIFSDDSYTAYTNQNYQDATRTDSITSESPTRTTTLS